MERRIRLKRVFSNTPVLVMLLLITGILLKLVYEPFPGTAYDSIILIQNDVWFGQLVRNIHHWSANILVIVVLPHMLRVFFTGAFHHPRQFNWIIGLFLFFFVLISNFTGYLLPWDQLAFWAITISTSMVEYIPGVGSWLQKAIRGGSEIGPESLKIFFTFHTTILPACLVILMPFHFWRVRNAGGVVMPRPSKHHWRIRLIRALVPIRPRPPGIFWAYRRCCCTFTPCSQF